MEKEIKILIINCFNDLIKDEKEMNADTPTIIQNYLYKAYEMGKDAR